MISKTTRSFRNVERQIMLTIGALILLLMTLVLLAGDYYLEGVMEREENKLSTILTQVLSKSVSRVSFSGKYHARLFLQELKAAQPEINYLLIAEKNGRVLAHSNPQLNDSRLSPNTIKTIKEVIVSDKQFVRNLIHDNQSIREITLPYKGGYNDAVEGVIQVGLSTQSRHEALMNGIIYIVFVVLGLLVIGGLIAYRIGTYFGNPIKQFANDMEATLHAIPDLLFELDESGHYKKFITHRKDLQIKSSDKILNHTIDQVLPEAAAKVMRQAINEAKNEGDSHGRQILINLPHGEFWYELSVAKKSNLNTKEDHFIVISRDITQRKYIEQEIIRLNSNLEERVAKRNAELQLALEKATCANNAKTEFLSNMSHELRTPLNAIMGFGQLLDIDKSLTSTQKSNVQEILVAGDHLLSLINEVLDLSKIEAGHIELTIEPVNVCMAVEECLDLLHTLARKKGITIKHSHLEGVMVRADSTRFRQSLLNLLSNAIKYNRDNGTIEIKFDFIHERRLRISIIDSGYGIAQEQMHMLFKPFNRLNAAETNIEGTGIGLTLTKQFVELMGGVIEVSSEIGEGSTFAIELPIDNQMDIDEEVIGTDMDLSFKQTETKQYKVLYIEDNIANTNLVTQILEHRPNIELITAQTPHSGIELALSEQPDLILLDIKLPGMNGYQVLEQLKSEQVLNDVPMIAVTASAMPDEINGGKQAGFSDYLTKPLDIEQFLKIIDAYLSTDDNTLDLNTQLESV